MSMATQSMAADRSAAKLAAGCWLATAAVYLIAETIAASAFPGYSYLTNFISDLGIPYLTVSDGRTISSPLASVMNAGFVLQALFFGSAAIIVGRALPVRGIAYAVFVGAALADATGLVLIALFHSGAREVANGHIVWHTLGAGLSILGGNLVAMSSGFALRPLGLPRFYRPAGIALGLVGLASIAWLMVGPKVIPAGLVERASVYTITVWEIMTATLLLRAARR